MFTFVRPLSTVTQKPLFPAQLFAAALFTACLVTGISACGDFDVSGSISVDQGGEEGGVGGEGGGGGEGEEGGEGGDEGDRPIRQFPQRLIAKSSVPASWRAGDDCRRTDLVPPPSNLFVMLSSGTNWSCGN